MPIFLRYVMASKKTQADDICKAGQGISLILLNSAMCLSVPGVKGTSLILMTKPLRAADVKTHTVDAYNHTGQAGQASPN